MAFLVTQPIEGIAHHFGAGVYARQMQISAGEIVGKHKHTYDHLSVLASGTVVVTTDEQQEELTGPCCLAIKAGTLHTIHALTDAVWFCIHPESRMSEINDLDGVTISKAED